MKQVLLSDLVHHKAEVLRDKAALKIRNKQKGACFKAFLSVSFC